MSLFSASGGINNLMTAVNVAYDEDDDRSPIKKRLIALALTLGAIVFIVIMLGLVAVVRPAPTLFGDSPLLRFLFSAARWILLVILVTAALAVLYRVAPNLDAPKIRWVSVGAAIATLLWLIASIGFSIYVATFGNYAKTYGVFAGIIVLLFWLWITSYAVLLGAEINAEAEQQTATDTTHGPDNPSANATPSKPTPPPATTPHHPATPAEPQDGAVNTDAAGSHANRIRWREGETEAQEPRQHVMTSMNSTPWASGSSPE